MLSSHALNGVDRITSRALAMVHDRDEKQGLVGADSQTYCGVRVPQPMGGGVWVGRQLEASHARGETDLWAQQAGHPSAGTATAGR